MLLSFLCQFCWSAITRIEDSPFLKLLTNKSDAVQELESFKKELYEQCNTYKNSFSSLINKVIDDNELLIFNQVETNLNRNTEKDAPKINKFDIIDIVDVIAPIGLDLSSECDDEKIFQSQEFKCMYYSASEMYLILEMLEKLGEKNGGQNEIIEDFLKQIGTRMLEIIMKEKNQHQKGSKRKLPQDHLEIFKASNAKYVECYKKYKSILNSNLTLYEALESFQSQLLKNSEECNNCEVCFWSLKYRIRNFLGSNFFVYREKFDEATLMKLYNIYITMSINISVQRTLYDCHFETSDGVLGAKNLYGKSLYADFKKIMSDENTNPEIYVSQ